MGQQHIGAAILDYLEGYHVQTVEHATLLRDSASTPEASLIQVFTEVRRHKPSALYMPGIDAWWQTSTDSVKSTLLSLLSTIPVTDQILLLGHANDPFDVLPTDLKDIFGHAPNTHVAIQCPSEEQRFAFFNPLSELIRKVPRDFIPSLGSEKTLEVLPVAPPPPPRPLSKHEIKQVEQKDRKTKLHLRAKLGPLMELLKTRYKRFKRPIIVSKTLMTSCVKYVGRARRDSYNGFSK